MGVFLQWYSDNDLEKASKSELKSHSVSIWYRMNIHRYILFDIRKILVGKPNFHICANCYRWLTASAYIPITRYPRLYSPESQFHCLQYIFTRLYKPRSLFWSLSKSFASNSIFQLRIVLLSDHCQNPTHLIGALSKLGNSNHTTCPWDEIE